MFPFKNHAENEAGRLVPELFLWFKKALYEVKASGLQLSFNIFWYFSTWLAFNNNKLYKTLDYWCRDMLVLIFQKGVWEVLLWSKVSVTLFWFFKQKYFSCYILLTDQISLHDCLYLLSIYWSVCHVLNYSI